MRWTCTEIGGGTHQYGVGRLLVLGLLVFHIEGLVVEGNVVNVLLDNEFSLGKSVHELAHWNLVPARLLVRSMGHNVVDSFAMETFPFVAVFRLSGDRRCLSLGRESCAGL